MDGVDAEWDWADVSSFLFATSFAGKAGMAEDDADTATQAGTRYARHIHIAT